MKALRPIAVACFTVALVASPAPIIQADNAPVYETPQGLGPGVKNTTVRMANEQVDIQVVERGDAAIAIVNATFIMINNGPTVQVLTGFPDADYGDNGNPDLPGGGYLFTPANITNFRAWTDAATFSATHPTVSAGQYQGEPWFVWNVTYPQQTSLPVHVAYQQNLGEQQGCDGCRVSQYVNVIYVLRTGALWAGNIDDAHITFEANDGGGFVGADGASTVANGHIVWDFTNFKPTSDVGTVYVFATPWKELQAAEAAANQPGAGPTDFLRAAQDAILLLGADQPGWDSAVSPFLAKRYASEMEQWAASASVLNTPDSWKALGDADVFASGAIGRKGAVECWPNGAAAAYQQAADLGSDSAGQDLANLHAGFFLEGAPRGDVEEILPSCGS
jgi:hypothetical protein